MFYSKSPFKAVPTLLIQGTPEYVYGSLNDKTGPTLGYIISDSAITTTATVTFRIASGNVPTPNSLVTVVGATNSANFNVVNATIITVTCTDAGICTISYAITSSTVAAGTADAGQVYIAVPEVPDNLTAAIVSALDGHAGASAPVAAPVGSTAIGRSISVTVNLLANSTTYPSTLSGVTIVIQGANKDRDDYYNTIGTITAAGAAGSVYDWQSGQGADKSTGTGVLADGYVNLPQFLFYRLSITAATGAGYLTGSIMV